MSAVAPVIELPTGVGYDPLRDSRHRTARSAREQADWLAWLELGGLRPRTLADYEWASARLMRMFPEKSLAEFTDGDLLHCARSFPAKSRRVRMAALESWFHWGIRTRRLRENPMLLLPHIKRAGKTVIDVFTDAEVEALIGLPDNDGDLFLLLFDAGLRRGEARMLTRGHVYEAETSPQLVVLDGKGGKDRIVPLTVRVTQRLAKWFLLDAMRADEYLWPTRPGGYYLRRDRAMGDTSFTNWYRLRLEAAGVRYRKPHTTRHTFATRWLRRGGRLETLSQVMGHESIRTTFDLYAHLDTTDIVRDLHLVEAGG